MDTINIYVSIILALTLCNLITIVVNIAIYALMLKLYTEYAKNQMISRRSGP